MKASNMSKGLYIHIPFCKYICSYCDFGKKYIHNQPVEQYIDCLISEFDMYEPFSDVDSIYIGGGTPSSISHNLLEKLLKRINLAVDIDQIKEFSFECNPDDITDELCILLKKYGVTRISLGAQTVNDDILKLVHRKHTATDVITGYMIASNYFNNVSVDFMFNLPTQTIEDIEQIFSFIKAKEPNHISFYGLIFEDHTRLANEQHKYWSEEQEVTVYKLIQKELNNLGFINYEISNYAKPGYQSIHNIHYWQNDEYYGLGLSASGYIDGMRYTNTYSLKTYMQIIESGNKPIKDREIIDVSEREYERIMLGLRHYQYLELGEKTIKYIKDNQFLQDKFDFDDKQVRLKREFYYISNQIIIDILEGVF